jgi:FtsH-binding integral membrane protein
MANAYHLQTSIPVADLSTDARATFITRTYTHLLGAVIGFTLIEITLFTNGMADVIAQAMLGQSWLLALGGFMVVAWLASRVAHTATSTGLQYGALAAFVCAEAILFVPLLFTAQAYAPGVIQSAATITLLGFGGLTAVAMTSRKDFTFRRRDSAGDHRCRAAVRLSIGNLVFRRDDCLCRWCNPVRHLKRALPLPGRSLRRSVS